MGTDKVAFVEERRHVLEKQLTFEKVREKKLGKKNRGKIYGKKSTDKKVLDLKGPKMNLFNQ
jgi:hypothetical protein